MTADLEASDLGGKQHLGASAMLCETCRWTERPGFIRRPAKPDPAACPDDAADFVPCPDCGGQAIAHCCEGLCEQPDAPDASLLGGQ
jgi:hypothetical protein